MVSSPDGKGIILIGGYNRDFGIANKFLYELRPEKFTWQKLSQTLKTGRHEKPVVMRIPKPFTSCRKLKCYTHIHDS